MNIAASGDRNLPIAPRMLLNVPHAEAMAFAAPPPLRSPEIALTAIVAYLKIVPKTSVKIFCSVLMIGVPLLKLPKSSLMAFMKGLTAGPSLANRLMKPSRAFWRIAGSVSAMSSRGPLPFFAIAFARASCNCSLVIFATAALPPKSASESPISLSSLSAFGPPVWKVLSSLSAAGPPSPSLLNSVIAAAPPCSPRRAVAAATAWISASSCFPFTPAARSPCPHSLTCAAANGSEEASLPSIAWTSLPPAADPASAANRSRIKSIFCVMSIAIPASVIIVPTVAAIAAPRISMAAPAAFPSGPSPASASDSFSVAATMPEDMTPPSDENADVALGRSAEARVLNVSPSPLMPGVAAFTPPSTPLESAEPNDLAAPVALSKAPTDFPTPADGSFGASGFATALLLSVARERRPNQHQHLREVPTRRLCSL